MTDSKHKKSLILGLYEEFNGPVNKGFTKKYSESTQTLYRGKNINNDFSSKIKEITVSQTIFEKIVRGERHFILTKEKGFLLGEEINIVAGNSNVYKTVLDMITPIEEPALNSSYIILSF